MANLNANSVFVIHLCSYGFFHSGRERLRTQVLKRVWEHIPGSTLYGATAAALIRLDGIEENAEPFYSGSGGYHELIKAVKQQEVRFTPLLPVTSGKALTSAADYCTQALQLHAALYADELPKWRKALRKSQRKILHSGPHAPLNRETERIHGDQVFVLRTHRPLLHYYGFIFARSDLKSVFERALRLFPLMPVGGRGKFSLVEARIEKHTAMKFFRDEFHQWLNTKKHTGWVRLLTPMVLNQGQPNELLTGTKRKMVMSGLRRYRVWRTGRYYDAQRETFSEAMGITMGAREKAGGHSPGGRESEAILAVPERSRFRQVSGDDVVDWFVTGVGNPSWTYLGWGQVVIE